MDRFDEMANAIIGSSRVHQYGVTAAIAAALRQVREETIRECAGVAWKRAAVLGISSSHQGQSRAYEAET